MTGLTFIFGLLAAAAALLLQVFVSLFIAAPFVSSPPLLLLMGAATIEEGAKLVFLLQLQKRTPTPVSLRDALIFGIGFVVAEITLITLSATGRSELLSLAAIAAIQIAGTLIVYASLRLRKDFLLSPVFGLLAAVLLHSLYNSSL